MRRENVEKMCKTEGKLEIENESKQRTTNKENMARACSGIFILLHTYLYCGNWCGNDRVIEKMMILPIKWHRNCLQTKLENVKG